MRRGYLWAWGGGGALLAALMWLLLAPPLWAEGTKAPALGLTSPLATPTSTPTPTPSATPTSTATPTDTPVATRPPTPTWTPTPTPTATFTVPPSPTPTPTPSPTPTSPPALGDIQGIVWQDDNRNGQRDTEEPALSGVQIVLMAPDRTVLSVTFSAGDGRYAFANLPAGQYIVQEQDRPGYASSTPNEVLVNVQPGQTWIIDFGDYPLSPTPTPTPVPTATFTPTPTSTPTSAPTPTPTFTPTPAPTPTPTPWPTWCRDIIVNPGFEGRDGWDLFRTPYAPGYVNATGFPAGARPLAGNWAMRLGTLQVVDPESYSSVRQLIDLPSDAHLIRLEFWRWTFSLDTNGGDRQEVLLLSPDTRQVQAVLWRANPAENARRWILAKIDLLAYKGNRFLLYFNVYNDHDTDVSAMFLDEVHLYVCAPPTPNPLPSPTPTPLPTATPTQAAPRPAEMQPAMAPSPTPTPTPATTPALRERIQTALRTACILATLIFAFLFLLMYLILTGRRHEAGGE